MVLHNLHKLFFLHHLVYHIFHLYKLICLILIEFFLIFFSFHVLLPTSLHFVYLSVCFVIHLKPPSIFLPCLPCLSNSSAYRQLYMSSSQICLLRRKVCLYLPPKDTHLHLRPDIVLVNLYFLHPMDFCFVRDSSKHLRLKNLLEVYTRRFEQI